MPAIFMVSPATAHCWTSHVAFPSGFEFFRCKKSPPPIGFKENNMYLCSVKDKKNMIVTGQTTNQKAKTTTTRERVMANTVSVDEYFDELISQVHQDYAEL